MNIFDHWQDEERKSTMTKIMEENARLRRTGRIDAIVYWTCIVGIAVVVAFERAL